jgi:hypothetical protein
MGNSTFPNTVPSKSVGIFSKTDKGGCYTAGDDSSNRRKHGETNDKAQHNYHRRHLARSVEGRPSNSEINEAKQRRDHSNKEPAHEQDIANQIIINQSLHSAILDQCPRTLGRIYKATSVYGHATKCVVIEPFLQATSL